MSQDYSDHYSWHGWSTGADCHPEEPGKNWLTITEDGEEYAIIVLRTGAFERQSEINEAEVRLEKRAARIAAALNAYRETDDGGNS